MPFMLELYGTTSDRMTQRVLQPIDLQHVYGCLFVTGTIWNDILADALSARQQATTRLRARFCFLHTQRHTQEKTLVSAVFWWQQ